MTATAPLGGLGFGQQQQQNATPVPVTGTSNPPYQIFSEKEQGQTFSTNFHAITMMPAYRNASFEVCVPYCLVLLTFL
jgi:nuclear pore complex protein Nup98-Nup96